jgi:alkyl hydroperoxide reductase subunit AhpC
MSLHIGSVAPDFEQDSSEGKLSFHKFLGDKWGVLFSHSADFTAELGRVAKLKSEFDKRNVKVVALSVEAVPWVDFPILADGDRKVSRLYRMIRAEANDALAVRSVFIIDPNKKIRLIITYPASTSRNFAEILSVIDSLQMTDDVSRAGTPPSPSRSSRGRSTRPRP